MNTMFEINKNKVPAVRIDHSLDKYDDIVLFPDKLAIANDRLRESGFPNLMHTDRNVNAAKSEEVVH